MGKKVYLKPSQIRSKSGRQKSFSKIILQSMITAPIVYSLSVFYTYMKHEFSQMKIAATVKNDFR